MNRYIRYFIRYIFLTDLAERFVKELVKTSGSPKWKETGLSREDVKLSKNIMSRRNAFLFKIIVFLFALNCFSLYVYLHRYGNPKVHLHDHQQPQQQIQKHHQLPVSVLNFHAKPWPILPSYLPWSSDPNVPPYSCEGYFGNGFNRRIELLLPSPVISRGSLPSDGVRGGQGGWFRCFYSQSLESSICEGGRIRMNPDRIRMSVGGENLKSVIGRDEKQELPSFDSGAFEVEFAQGLNRSENVNGGKLVNQEFLYHLVPKGTVTFHTMRALLDSMRLVDAEEFRCSEWVEEPTLLVTRFEYANLFHTVTDWYSAYVASRVTGMPNRPHLVFLDGHCKTQLEETWKALFTSLRYSKNFSGPVCFRHAVLSPLGYETALFKGLKDPPIDCQGATAHDLRRNPNDRKTARLSEFGEMIQAAFGFPVIRNQCPELVSGHNVLFVRREDYLAHPRHAGKVESRLTNEEEVFEALKIWAFNHLKCKVNLVNGLFAHMPMKEQVRAIRDASVIIGAHGAGLTHVIAASPNAVVLEIVSYDFRRPHFKLISRWRGLKYYAIYLDESRADPKVVIKTVSSIINSLGC